MSADLAERLDRLQSAPRLRHTNFFGAGVAPDVEARLELTDDERATSATPRPGLFTQAAAVPGHVPGGGVADGLRVSLGCCSS